MKTTSLFFQKTFSGARVKHFPKGQIMLYAGDPVSDVLIIKSGVIKLYDIDVQGNEKILHLATTPSLIPFAFFSGMHISTLWFYSALTDCEVWVVEQEKLLSMMESDYRLASLLVANFSKDVHELLVRLSSLGKTLAQEKIVIALKFLSVKHSKQRPSGWQRVNFPVNHQMLADMTGITRESTATVMKELQENNIIRNPRQTILEINKSRLTKLG